MKLKVKYDSPCSDRNYALAISDPFKTETEIELSFSCERGFSVQILPDDDELGNAVDYQIWRLRDDGTTLAIGQGSLKMFETLTYSEFGKFLVKVQSK